jgi:hypothetical protein
MITHGFSLTQISQAVPWVDKSDIYGLSLMLDLSMELTQEERAEVKQEYRRTGKPLEVLFTPVEARCSYLDIWGTKKYPDIITDIKDGKFMDMSMEEFEEKRKKWVKEIRETAHPMLRIVKAIRI